MDEPAKMVSSVTLIQVAQKKAKISVEADSVLRGEINTAPVGYQYPSRGVKGGRQEPGCILNIKSIGDQKDGVSR